MPLSKKNTIFLLPKGKNYQKEIEKAKKLWKFSYKVVKNSLLLDKSGGVTLEIIALKKK
jgi:16S rRNA G527 N7-methylase RsmG